MKKFFAKMKKVRMMPYSKLTSGEKVVKFVMTALKVALIIAVVLSAGYILFMLAALTVFSYLVCWAND